MPEMPEVEVARRGLQGPLEGAEVLELRLGKPLRWPLGVAPEHLAGLRLHTLWRRGKYLWLVLEAPFDDWAERHALPPTSATPLCSHGPAGSLHWPAPLHPAGGLLIHLGMSGMLGWHPAGQLPEPGEHDHLRLITNRGELRLTDPRRFGAVIWSPSLESGMAAKLLGRLGAEPFDPELTASALCKAWAGRRVPIKQALLAGDAVVGAGNIYACEALFMAGISPALPAGELSLRRAKALLHSVREVLAQALALGGSTLRDFKDAHGMAGGFQAHARVYGREGKPCPRCERPIRRSVQANRSTFYCTSCQRR